MHWLIITENQDKASRIREVLRGALGESDYISATLISSRGLPWTVEVEVAPNELSYKVKEKASYREILKKIDEISQEADRILLAFEPTNAGEATAWEFEKRLGYKRCGRFKTYDLDEKTIKETIVQFESLDINGLPKANNQMAKAHWTQAVIDLTWASKINEWLSKITNYSAKATRLMGIMLKTIAQSQRREKRYQTTTHWELSLEFKHCSHQNESPQEKNYKELDTKITKAHVIVPTLAQIGTDVGPKAREFWEQKLNQSREESIKGWEIPQPEPGKPWRFHQQEDTKIQKQYIKKFPYFIVEGASTVLVAKDLQCPPTNNNIHDYCAQNDVGPPEEIERALNTLYTQGLISNPKSNFPSLSAQSVEKMYNSWHTHFPNLTKEIRAFHTEESGPNRMEAIHPTNWPIDPQKIRSHLQKITSLKLSKEELNKAEFIYQKVFTWCLESQKKTDKTKVVRHFLSGPLFLSRKQAQERDGKAFHIKKEEPFHAHMTVLAMTDYGNVPPKGNVMECTESHIKEIETTAPQTLDEKKLLSLLCSQQAGKRDTILNILGFLRDSKTISNSKDLKLTHKGEEFLQILEHNFGQYLDTNYLKTLNSNLVQIEKGIKSDEEILNQWWFSLRSFLQSSKEDGKLLHWDKKNH